MLFNSFSFVAFFLVFYLLFLASPQRHKWKIFLLGSWVFYAAFEPAYLFLLFFITIVDFAIGREIYRSEHARRKLFLLLALVANVGLLFFFKYAGFFGESLSIFSLHNPVGNLSILLPIGISFYTFQGLSYVIDIYRRKIKPEENLGIFSLYISAFPQLIAGPIERAEHLIPQLKKKFSFAKVPLREASFLILIGYIKKLVIADNLGIIVDQVYASPGNYESPVLLIATLFFGFQIYADFSGYVDIARGLGKLLGINFVLNFNKPYFSLNISEFWQRWHISLSSWVKDYVYIPLGGNRKGEIRQFINLVLTMAIMGLWHGAGFPFLLWGIYHGILLALHKLILKIKITPPIPNPIKIGVTFFLVNAGWILFRSETLQDAALVFRGIFHVALLLPFRYIEGMALGLTLILALVLFEIFDKQHQIGMRIQKAHPFILGIFYVIAIHLLLFFGIKQSLSFIYFQF